MPKQVRKLLHLQIPLTVLSGLLNQITAKLPECLCMEDERKHTKNNRSFKDPFSGLGITTV